MSERDDEGARTFETVRARYMQWEQARPARDPYDWWSPGGHPGGMSMGRIVLTAVGVGVGFMLLVLAAISFWAAVQWAQVGREPATIGYAVVGCFLTVAGIGAILGTLNHTLRVLDPNRAPAHH